MKIKNRVLSLILVIAILVTALPLTAILVSAAADYSDCSFNPKDTCAYGETFKFSGKITSDYTIKKVTVGIYNIKNGGEGIWYYTNQYVNDDSFSLSNIKSFTIGEVLESVSGSNAEIDTASFKGITIIIYVVTEAKDEAQKFEYEIDFEDLDTPTVSSPDEDDTFYAGDDITFKWGSVSGAEEFEWEFYENIKSSGRLLDSGSTGTSSTSRKAIIDGDMIKAGNAYSFYVRATNDYSESTWEWLNFYAYAKPSELYADPEELSFTKDGGYDYIDLTSSHDWTATVSDSWIKLSDDSGTGDEEIKVTVSANTGASRVGVITIKSEVGTIHVNVIQAKGEASKLEVGTTKIQTSYEEGYESFSVTSNLYDWKVSSNVDWLSVTSVGLDLNDNVKISVDENKSIEPRTGTITVTGGGITKTVTVTQDGRPAIVGDINNDGEITNKDRFLLNRYLANMAGYTSIDKTLADINGDGSVTDVDAEYLSRHLAGWAGYEKLPEINTGTSGCAHTQYTDTYYNTVYVSDTIKTNTTHTYYHVYNRKCSCGMDIGKVQGDLITEAHSYVNNLCACGAYNDASYEKWIGVNVSDAQANVYNTPSATVRYGYINKNEVVTVIGEYGDKYLIEYALDGGKGVKQGYIVKSAITSLELVERENLIEEIEKTYFDPRSQYERYDDLAKDEISINFFDLMFADITDLGGVVEKCLDLGDADIVNSQHAIITLMENMDDSVYVENTTECIDVIYALYDWIQKTPYDDVKSMFSGMKDQAKVIAAISDIKSMKIDNVNNALSQGIEYLFECGLDNDAILEKYAEILSLQLGNLDKKAALQKVKKAANTFGNVVGGVIDALDKIAKPVEAFNAFYNVAIKDYTVELTKLYVLEAIFEEYRYTHLLVAVRELKTEMENEFNRIVTAAKKLAIEKSLEYLLDKTNGLWAIIAGAVEITVGQDAMAKRDACYILEMEDATYWYIKSLIYSYQESSDIAILEKINKALHMYTDCKTTLNDLAIELNTWGIFVTDKDKYDYLSIYKYWYSHQHDDIDTLFAEVGIK